MKILCIGRNYAEHAKELKNEIQEEPILFMKAKNALLMPDKPLYYPEFTDDLHYECELVVKVCKNGKYIQEKFAKNYYQEVTVGLDFTARDVQKRLKDKGLPWEKSKAFDGSAAVGNFIPMDDDMKARSINFQLHLNNNLVQDGHTADMLNSIPRIIAHASKYFTLNIGDLIFTGTPAGVGPVTVYDRLEGYLEGQKLLDVDIR